MIGKAIRSLRKERYLSLKVLSARSGISLNALSKIELGDSSPSFPTLVSLASGLDLPLTLVIHAMDESQIGATHPQLSEIMSTVLEELIRQQNRREHLYVP